MSRNRIALVGAAGDAAAQLSKTLDELLADDNLRHVVYLGADNALDEAMAMRVQATLTQDTFLDRGVELACADDPAGIDALLEERRATQQLATVRRLPEAPALAVDMLEKWILVMVHDKAVLEEDDIANAHVIIYGNAKKPYFKRFGPRCFFTPGPLSGGHIGRLELANNGDLTIQLLDSSGEAVQTETLSGAGTKFSVAT